MKNEQTDNLTKKERSERKRLEKQSKLKQRIIVKKIKSVSAWGISVVALFGVFYWFVQTMEKNNANRPGEAVAVMGEEHIQAGQDHDPYNSNPPTSGPHAGPAPWGFSPTEIPEENVVHNLEHGGIWISYKNLDSESVALLEDIARRNSKSVIVSPREDNDANVAVASWGRLMKLDAVDEVRIKEFIQKNKNRSPERLAI